MVTSSPTPNGRERRGQGDSGAPEAILGAVGRSLTDDVKRLTAVFDAALAQRDAEAATAATLELESSLHAWSADTFQSDEVDRAEPLCAAWCSAWANLPLPAYVIRAT